MNFRYKAFISYSHTDERWAAWLQRRLEGYRNKRPMTGAHPLRPVFRDRSELTAGELGPAIEAALAASEALIVICSPAAAASEWVAAEIRTFKSLHHEPLILPLVVQGDPSGVYDAVFPEPLRYRGEDTHEPLELLAADARSDKDGRSEAFLKIAAALLGASFDALRQRAQAARFKRLLVIAAGASAVAAGAVALSAVALLAREEAEEHRAQAEELVTFMIGDVRDELAEIGRLDILEAVGDKALAYFESLEADDLTPYGLLQRSRALRQIGDVRIDRGQFEDGLALYRLALETLDSLGGEHSGDMEERLDLERARTYLATSTVHYMRGDIAPSISDSLKHRGLMAGLVYRHPENVDYLAELADADNNLGALAMARGETTAARSHFGDSLATLQKLIEQNPMDAALRARMGGVQIWLGSVAERQGLPDVALESHRAAVEQLRMAVRLEPTPGNREALSRSLTILSVDTRDRDAHGSLAHAREAVDLLRGLTAYEPDNADWQQKLNRAIAITIGTELELGCSAEIPGLVTELRGRADELLARDASYIENHRDRIEADLLGARYAIGTGSPQQATTMAVAAVSRAADVIAMNPHDDLSKRYYLRATELLSRSRWLGGDESGARQAAQAAVDLIGEEPIEDPSAARLLDRLVLAAAGGSPRELNRGNHGCDDRSDNLVPPFDTANSER